MKSNLQFFSFDNDQASDCGDVLDIEFSSSKLNWPGVILEKGCSPHFYPTNVYTPYFYFALALDQDLHWQVETEHGISALKTTPGNIWINPPSTPFTHEISEPCYFIILAIEKETFLQNCSLNFKDKPLQFLNNYNVHDETIKGIIELFLLEAKANGQNGQAYLKNMLSLLTTHYIQNYSNYSDIENARSADSKFDQGQVDKIREYIQQNIGSHITVDDLAELLKCSKYYFLREFKKFVGITPYQYLINQRLEQAKTRLINGANIASVVYDLGFNDQPHFTRMFKNHFGMTPKQFQKQHP